MIDSRSRVEDILNVILGNLDPSALQPPQSRVEALLQKLNEMISDFDGKIPVHICTSGEYDHETLMPTIEDPEENAFYLVPANDSGDDMYIEWIFTESNRWERFGSGGGTVTIEQSDWNQNDSSQADFIKNKPDLTLKLDKNQGAANSGKFMGVNSSGNVVPLEVEGGNIAVTEELVSGEDYELTVEEGETGSVISVAGKTGTVTLDGDDVVFNDAGTYNDGTIGGTVADLKSQVFEVEVDGKIQKSTTSTVVKLFEDDISNVHVVTDSEVHILGPNRIDIDNAVITHDGYGSTVITKTETGFMVYYPGGGTSKSAFISYTAEFDGNLYVSCRAHTDGNVRDLRMNVTKNGAMCAQCYGPGLLKQVIEVDAGDTIQMRFLMRNQDNIPNTVYYEDIMVSYTDQPFCAFNDRTNKSIEVITHILPTDVDEYTTSNPASGVSGKNLTMLNKYADIPVPTSQSVIPVGLTVTGLPLVPYNSVYNGTVGLGISTSRTLMIRVDGLSTRPEYMEWLTANPVSVSWDGTEYIISPFNADDYTFEDGDIITIASAEQVDYYYKPEKVAKKLGMVCFGDSITGMYGYGTDYPSMITDNSDIEAINCGFSGSTWTDYGTGNLMPFSLNRLVESIVSSDFSLQDNVIGAITTAYYAEHFANLKAVDWTKITYATFLAGVNDWYYAQHPLYSQDDPSTDNKQRTNVQDAVTYCIQKLLSKYPHLKIIVATPYHAYFGTTDSDTTPNANGKYLIEYADVIVECAEGQRMPHINQYITSGVNQATMYYYTSDGTHPNEAMKHMIAKRIIKCADTITA